MKDSMCKITRKVSELIKDNQTIKQEILISRVNEITRGWANYHHATCAKKSFSTNRPSYMGNVMEMGEKETFKQGKTLDSAL